MKLISRLNVAPILRMSGDVPPILHKPLWFFFFTFTQNMGLMFVQKNVKLSEHGGLAHIHTYYHKTL